MTDFAREPRTSHNGQGSHSRKTPSTPKARRIQPSMFIEVTAIVGNFATTDHLNPEAVAAYADGELGQKSTWCTAWNAGKKSNGNGTLRNG